MIERRPVSVLLLAGGRITTEDENELPPDEVYIGDQNLLAHNIEVWLSAGTAQLVVVAHHSVTTQYYADRVTRQAVGATLPESVKNGWNECRHSTIVAVSCDLPFTRTKDARELLDHASTMQRGVEVGYARTAELHWKYPGIKKSSVHLAGVGEVSPANVVLAHDISIGVISTPLERLAANRKNPLRAARQLGPSTVLLGLRATINCFPPTLKALECAVSRNVGAPARAHEVGPDFGFDVDNLARLALAREVMAGR